MLKSLSLSPHQHLRWVTAQLEATERLFHGAKLLWLAEMDAYAEDAQLALRWALQHLRVNEGLRLALAMARYWWVVGERSTGRGWLRAFISPPGAPTYLVRRARHWLLALQGRDD